jgi:1-aminocyclopropane-1-carboxylate deaminase
LNNIIAINKTILQQIDLPHNSKLELYTQREDLIHPYINGNKWYKLKYNLEEAKKEAVKTC